MVTPDPIAQAQLIAAQTQARIDAIRAERARREQEEAASDGGH